MKTRQILACVMIVVAMLSMSVGVALAKTYNYVESFPTGDVDLNNDNGTVDDGEVLDLACYVDTKGIVSRDDSDYVEKYNLDADWDVDGGDHDEVDEIGTDANGNPLPPSEWVDSDGDGVYGEDGQSDADIAADTWADCDTAPDMDLAFGSPAGTGLTLYKIKDMSEFDAWLKFNTVNRHEWRWTRGYTYENKDEASDYSYPACHDCSQFATFTAKSFVTNYDLTYHGDPRINPAIFIVLVQVKDSAGNTVEGHGINAIVTDFDEFTNAADGWRFIEPQEDEDALDAWADSDYKLGPAFILIRDAYGKKAVLTFDSLTDTNGSLATGTEGAAEFDSKYSTFMETTGFVFNGGCIQH